MTIKENIFLGACLNGLDGGYNNFEHSIQIPHPLMNYKYSNVVVALKVWSLFKTNKCKHMHFDIFSFLEFLPLEKVEMPF